MARLFCKSTADPPAKPASPKPKQAYSPVFLPAPSSDGSQPNTDGLQPTSDGVHSKKSILHKHNDLRVSLHSCWGRAVIVIVIDYQRSRTKKAGYPLQQHFRTRELSIAAVSRDPMLVSGAKSATMPCIECQELLVTSKY